MGSEKGRLRIEYVSPDVLKPFKGNPRVISERGLEKLQISIEHFGFTNPILVQRGTNMVIAGHQRLKAAKAAGLTEVPVIYLDMDDATAKAYNVADNRLAEEADWDDELLADLLSELERDDFDLSLTGFDDDEIERLLNWGSEPEIQIDREPQLLREKRQVIIVVNSDEEAAAVGAWAEARGYEWHVQVVPVE